VLDGGLTLRLWCVVSSEQLFGEMQDRVGATKAGIASLYCKVVGLVLTTRQFNSYNLCLLL
jgi:hypothetical protein